MRFRKEKMASPYAIRSATLGDYDGICAVLEEVDAIHHLSEPDFFKPASRARRTLAYIGHYIESDESAIFVAEIQGSIIGVPLLCIRTTPDESILKPRRWINIDILAVKEGWRSQGIGHALLAQAEDWARIKGIDELELSIWSFNQRALALYEQTGFRILRHNLWKTIK